MNEEEERRGERGKRDERAMARPGRRPEAREHAPGEPVYVHQSMIPQLTWAWASSGEARRAGDLEKGNRFEQVTGDIVGHTCQAGLSIERPGGERKDSSPQWVAASKSWVYEGTIDEVGDHHFQPRVQLSADDGGGVTEDVIPLDSPGAGDRVRTAVATEGLLTIHTEEATLEDVFIEFAGRGLE